MPIIANMVPHCNKFLRAEKIMNPNVVSLKVVDTVENIFNAIKDSGHHAYPIVNSQKRGVGLVFSNFLITLMKKKHFYDQKKETQLAINQSEDEDPYACEDVLDSNDYPITKDADMLTYENFVRHYTSLDLKIDDELRAIHDVDKSKLIDLRPYMIEEAESVNKFDYLPKIVDKFRNLHLRHLIVTDIYTGEVIGMINRGDIFKWMPL